MKFLIFIGMNVFATLGWEAGEPYGIWAAFLLSGLGGILGVVGGWWLARRYLE